ncbi:hypothetical protein EVAR_30124_1 [Eumeta japonica]|uniref:Uncharacterized protein n=1 Tax=Eumeta variegata TaxID=151549 RepID=A0A4C1WG49_EUMVA|nr:hypothetical protein EVAR_30124_1 [Eumeta japonica]
MNKSIERVSHFYAEGYVHRSQNIVLHRYAALLERNRTTATVLVENPLDSFREHTSKTRTALAVVIAQDAPSPSPGAPGRRRCGGHGASAAVKAEFGTRQNTKATAYRTL